MSHSNRDSEKTEAERIFERLFPNFDGEAVERFKRGAEKGRADAQYKLGICYDLGRGVSQSDEEAAKWYKIAAENGNNEARVLLGICYKFGWGVQQSDEEALELFVKAADKGDMDVQYYLGTCYDHGWGVPQSIDKAYYWYEKAWEQGHEDAYIKVWTQDVGKRPLGADDSVDWYIEAAENGDSFAQESLGFFYDIGQWVPQSDEEAVRWYEKAADQGNC